MLKSLWVLNCFELSFLNKVVWTRKRKNKVNGTLLRHIFVFSCFLWSFWETLQVLLFVEGLKEEGWELKRHIYSQLLWLLLKCYINFIVCLCHPYIKILWYRGADRFWNLNVMLLFYAEGATGGRNCRIGPLKVDKQHIQTQVDIFSTLPYAKIPVHRQIIV